MVIWFALINTKPNEEHFVYNNLFKMEEVEYVYPLFGEWDLIIKVNGESNTELEEFMKQKVNNIDGVLAIKTLSGSIIH